MQLNNNFTTGLKSLDDVLKGILPGDNVVWEVDDIESYRAFVIPYAAEAVRAGRTLIYIRFASHAPLISESDSVEIVELNPSDGFEAFTDGVHQAVRDGGRTAHYIFDCLSELASVWLSDQMLGNFFRLTCPYLFDLETLAYFCIYRNQHSSEAIVPIQNTTQLFLNVYRHEELLYLRPLKVQHRYSSLMNMFHVWKDDKFKSVTESIIISQILTSSKWSGLKRDARPGFWEREFIRATEAVSHDENNAEKEQSFDRLLPMIFSRDPHIQELAKRYLSLSDLLELHRRMIGTGLIGGKAVGMVLARKVLAAKDKRFSNVLEEHDSFFIGSDVFYNYLVDNGIWWIRWAIRKKDNFLEEATRARRLVITGKFSDEIIRQFQEMLDYYGQSPFIVRSSSLLEDNYGNAFAGKYESVFCANQGPRERRLDDFLAAVRTIYASAMSEKALNYRARRGMLEQDEQMALLVMRVSGRMYNRAFYPPVAGVGFSFNPYVWDKQIDPHAGVLRLVFGLGTRAVDRSDDDYTRLVAINAPDKRPEHSFDQVRQYAQRRADYLDMEANQLVTGYCGELFDDSDELPLDLLTSGQQSDSGAEASGSMVLTFENLIKNTGFVNEMGTMLRLLKEAYDYPVDIEFTSNFLEDNSYKINLLQCRPLQVQGQNAVALPKLHLSKQNLIIEAKSAVVGQSRLVKIDKFIYVVPKHYAELTVQNRYAVSRVIGDINRKISQTAEETVMLIGPGRWGTSSPELGIPVHFSEINRVSIICEIVTMRENLIPDVSLGTHFLNELVEMDMLYLALFPVKEGNYLNESFFENTRSILPEILPGQEKLNDVVRVIDAVDLESTSHDIILVADAMEQRVSCGKILRGEAEEELSKFIENEKQ